MTALEVDFDEWKWKEEVQKLTNEHFALGIFEKHLQRLYQIDNRIYISWSGIY